MFRSMSKKGISSLRSLGRGITKLARTPGLSIMEKPEQTRPKPIFESEAKYQNSHVLKKTKGLRKKRFGHLALLLALPSTHSSVNITM